jgi:hypothetical protein
MLWDESADSLLVSGVITGDTIEATADTSSGDNAAIGYTASEGLILTGQGSTSDVTIKNDADATVLSIPTGTTNVGIGTTSATQNLSIETTSGDVDVQLFAKHDNSDSDARLFLTTYSGSATPTLYFGDNANSTMGYLKYANNGNSLQIATNSTEAMRIDTSGNVLMGTTSLIHDSPRLSISYDYTNSGICLESDTTTTHNAIVFTNPNGAVGTIQTSSSSTVYNTSSDYRLKENVSYDFDATTRLKQLKPARFNFIADADKTVDGFLAHEVSSIVPEAISGTKDAVDEDGKPEYQGIDQSKLVPLLVKTIQELEARITTLEANNP